MTTGGADPTLISAKDRQLLLEEAQYDCLAPNATTKRASYLSWDDYFMSVAVLSAQRSKDPTHPTGACIVDGNKRVIGIGYNGFPRNCSDDLLPWQKTTTETGTPWLHTPQAYETHAEVNAILNKCSADVAGATLYVQNFPCNECAKMIAQSRIREVVYIYDKQHDEEIYKASRIILQMSGVTLRQYQPVMKRVEIHFPSEQTQQPNKTQESSPKSVTAFHNHHNHNHHDTDKKKKKESLEMQEHRALLLKEANWTLDVSQKRQNYLSWDDYFMAMAFLSAKRSKDPNTQVGACIVSQDQRIIALGYNGFPRGCSDDALPWARKSIISELHTKYMYVCHAETNAILNKCSADVNGATIYVALFPCNECAKTIIQAGIREVVYLQDIYHDSDLCRASRIMFEMAGVKLRRHILAVEDIAIEL